MSRYVFNFTNSVVKVYENQRNSIIFGDMKNSIHINLTLHRTTKISLSRAGFELTSSGF